MNLHCKGCGLTWAALPTQVYGYFDESYEACPICRTDSKLEQTDDTEAYVFNEITGEIKNLTTGIVSLPVRKIPPPPPVPPADPAMVAAEKNYQQYIKNRHEYAQD